MRDAAVDLTLPFGNALEATWRFQVAEQAFLQQQPKRIVSHSLGASVCQHLLDKYPSWQGKAILLGAPRISWSEKDPRAHSFRHYGDLVSLLDRASSSSWRFGNPHSYSF